MENPPTPETIPPLYVTGRREADRVLRGGRPPLDWVISIGDVDEERPALVRHRGPWLRLEFDDLGQVDPLQRGFGVAHGERLVAFGRRIAAAPGPTLVHCAMGISRSSAAAVVLLALLHGPGRERAAVRALGEALVATARLGLRDDAWACPNRRVVAICDELLGLDRRLVDEVEREYGGG